MKDWMGIGFCGIGLSAMLIASSGCMQGEQASSVPESRVSTSRSDAQPGAASLLISPMVQVSLASGESMSGALVNMTEMVVQVQIGDSNQELAWDELEKIEPTGDVWAQGSSAPMKIRGDGRTAGEEWIVPRQSLQFIDASGNISPEIRVNLEGVQGFDEDRLNAIQQNRYLVQEIRSLSDGQVEIVVQVATPDS